jgi:NitT/TauT family transport system substrate-binding protein
MRGASRLFSFVLIAATLAVSCGGGTGTGGGNGQLTKVRLQLQWVAQSQFAGYYAALDKGYFKDLGLDVEIKLGGPDIVPQQVVASDAAEFGIAWVPKMLASREAGADLVNIAQVFQRSGTLEVSFKEKNITKPEDWKGKKVGTWGFGNEPELFAAMRKAGIDPAKASDVTVVSQPFDMSLLLNGQVDAAQAMIYNEYAQVLEQKNPKTGQLYTPAELNVIDFNSVGTGMLQDHIFVRDSWLKKSGNEDIAAKFLQASFKGWVFCRDNQSQCVDIVLKAGTTLGKGHMTWQLNEINALIWPSPNGIGMLDKASWDQTVNISTTYAVLKSKPADAAFRTDLAKKAADALKATGADINGASYKKATVQVTPGGN